ncbi:MAG TPA: hypothetical protein VFZ59_16185 [Verrucomicrobiae bacterium]|nr:hypothetical protein [Verrucomicrobiae bacterium]
MSDSNTAVESARAIGMLVGTLVGIVILLIPAIFYLLTLQKTLNRCSPENRAMQPGMVWLMFIPLFNLVWHFFVVLNIAKSLEAEFRKRGIASEPNPGKTLGLVMCILACCGIIPLIGVLFSLGSLVCWILYWIKIAGFSSRLAVPAGAPA